MRWILLQEILKIERRKCAQTVSVYPDYEFSPEVLLIEMMAQTGALVLGAESLFAEDLVFAKIESAEFIEKALPNEKLWIESGSDQVQREGAWLEGTVRTADKKIASSRFLLMNVGLLLPDTKRPVTFNDAFMKHYRVMEKIQ